MIYGDGKQTRDFVYVADVVKANILASQSSACGVFNIACGRSISLNTLTAMIGKILGQEVRPEYKEFRSGDIRNSLADISRAQKIGYAPKYDMERALGETIAWFSAGLSPRAIKEL